MIQVNNKNLTLHQINVATLHVMEQKRLRSSCKCFPHSSHLPPVFGLMLGSLDLDSGLRSDLDLLIEGRGLRCTILSLFDM